MSDIDWTKAKNNQTKEETSDSVSNRLIVFEHVTIRDTLSQSRAEWKRQVPYDFSLLALGSPLL